MTKIPEPVDCIGNLIIKDGYVTVLFKTVPIFKVIAVEPGGVHTPNGMTPALVRIVCDMTLRQMPGIRFESLARIMEPDTQRIIEGIASSLPRG